MTEAEARARLLRIADRLRQAVDGAATACNLKLIFHRNVFIFGSEPGKNAARQARHPRCGPGAVTR